MAHKVHPISFRIKGIADWRARGYYENNFPKLLEEDFLIREFLNKRLAKVGIADIEIERSPGRINIIIPCVRPGLIIGRQGQGIEELRKKLETAIYKNKTAKKDLSELRIEIREIQNPWSNANYLSQWVAQQLEKRMPYLKTLKQAIEKAMTVKEVQGVRVQVAGRLNGVEIARTAWLAKGRLPRQTIRANIDYALNEAHCTYGIIGVKVWIYKGEKI